MRARASSCLRALPHAEKNLSVAHAQSTKNLDRMRDPHTLRVLSNKFLPLALRARVHRRSFEACRTVYPKVELSISHLTHPRTCIGFKQLDIASADTERRTRPGSAFLWNDQRIDGPHETFEIISTQPPLFQLPST